MASPPDPILQPVINVGSGGKGAWRQPGSYGRTDSGYFVNYPYEGTRAEVESIAATFDAAGYSYEVTILKGGRASVMARTTANPSGGAEVPESIWEFEPQEIQKELTEADFPYGSLGAISAENKAVLVAALTHVENFETSSPAFTGATSADANSMFLLMARGVKTFPVEAPSIRHTQIVSNTYAVNVAYTNVGRILSRASMISLEGTGDLFLFDLPTTPTISQFIETAGDLQYGWRKIMPRVVRQTYNKWQVVNVWQFGLWATKLWGAVI